MSPCNSDYMEPHNSEIEHSQIACVLDEIEGRKTDRAWWRGYHPKVYCQTYDKYNSKYDPEKMLATVVNVLSHKARIQIQSYSLELQMWWRDYLEAEEKETRRKKNEKKRAALKKKALGKLNYAEKKALGLK